MNNKAETPFDNIEGSHEYVRMLAEAVNEARRDVEEEVAAAEQDRADRRKEALLLVSYNLAKLNLHITTSRRILNDLRTLRRLLLAERGLAMDDAEGTDREEAFAAAWGVPVRLEPPGGDAQFELLVNTLREMHRLMLAGEHPRRRFSLDFELTR